MSSASVNVPESRRLLRAGTNRRMNYLPERRLRTGIHSSCGRLIRYLFEWRTSYVCFQAGWYRAYSAPAIYCRGAFFFIFKKNGGIIIDLLKDLELRGIF